MTEDEAKTKRCVHRHPDNRYMPECIGSACMAWRWHVKAVVTGMAAYPTPQTTYVKTDQGYCGLAGSAHIDD